ncbi:unnamed protein product [Spirodela intermedia]|uniref:Uncharacterized protein n=1 Tax=Spirodela intermedia TaxID=51605 RepID=A0A7I8JCA2_SPIIN|nr:unnamed protein product [Spirodela intermedia]CAA6667818.1 unnamed protein product [Spirodela intermedia]
MFELFVVASEVSLAVVSLACVSVNLRKYGVRRFLFVDHDHGLLEKFRDQYSEKIQVGSFLLLAFWWILPCLVVKTAREVIRSLYTLQDSLWVSVATLVASIVSWTYLTTIFLSACALFNLVCNFQVIHFEEFGRLFERDVDVMHFLEEHVCLHYYLSRISHRFRIYLLLIFLFISASQVVTLFQTTGYSGKVNFTNAGDFAVSSVVQVVGIILCLHSASKISHKAQAIASLASKWHAMITCTSIDPSQLGLTNGFGNSQAMPSVTYLQGNPGGITIFGWTVDRGLINTIFFIELSLVLFVLGKTIVFSTK